VADALAHGSEKASPGGAKDGHAESPNAAQEASDLFYEMREITTNLNDPSGRQFVKIRLQLEATSPATRTLIERNQAPLRDAALFILSGKTQAEVRTPAGQERLKRELLARFNGLLEPN